MFLLPMKDIIIMLIGFVVLMVWLLLFALGNKNAGLFEALDEKEFPLKEVYGVGYALMEKIGYKYKSKSDRKLRQQVEVLYGERYADYYIRVIYAQKITISFTVFLLSFVIYGLTQEMLGFGVGVMFSGLAYYYFGTATSNKILKRSEEMLSDFSEVVSKLALLTNAGMILKEAWEDTLYAGDSSIYKEMQKTVEDINNGMAEVDAYHQFGKRCMIPEIKKFSSTIIQGVTKGNSELTMMMQEQSKEIWGMKKQSARRQGEKAASKLLIPICVMFVGILIMILVPIFTNIGA